MFFFWEKSYWASWSEKCVKSRFCNNGCIFTAHVQKVQDDLLLRRFSCYVSQMLQDFTSTLLLYWWSLVVLLVKMFVLLFLCTLLFDAIWGHRQLQPILIQLLTLSQHWSSISAQYKSIDCLAHSSCAHTSTVNSQMSDSVGPVEECLWPSFEQYVQLHWYKQSSAD